MVKKVFKEIIIALLLIAAILLILTVLFYDSIPVNKVVPSKVTFTLPEDLQEELDKTLEEEQEVIVSYKIEQSDLNVYEKNNSYDPGKSDPFSMYQVETNPTTSTGSGGNTQTSGNGNQTGSSSTGTGNSNPGNTSGGTGVITNK